MFEHAEQASSKGVLEGGQHAGLLIWRSERSERRHIQVMTIEICDIYIDINT